MQEDPYTTPNSDPINHPRSERKVSPIVLEHLRCTRPWVKFCSIIGFITAAFILVIVVLIVKEAMDDEPFPRAFLLSAFYFILAVLLVFPSLRLSRFEKTITRLLVTLDHEDLEIALSHQRAFWKQIALMILLFFLIFLVMLAVTTTWNNFI